MRYWAYLALKLLALGLALRYLWAGFRLLLPPPGSLYRNLFGYDLPWTLAAGLFFLICCGAVFLAALDQRYRCRVCLRRLRMPITAGSWGRMLQFGRMLRVSAVQTCGLEAPDLKRHSDDIWQELVSASEDEK